jgi:ribosomal 50S subunit-recycling heat shock protein
MERISEKQIVTKPSKVEVANDTLQITLEGKTYTFQIAAISKRLASASQASRQNFIVSPSGYGIHWPDADEDLSIPALIRSTR